MSNLSRYQERLLPTLLAAVEANATARESAPTTRWRRLRRSRTAQAGMAALTAALVAATGALLMRPNPAFAVKPLGNGLVRIDFERDFGEPEGLERELRALGVDVNVVGVHAAKCSPGRIVTIAYDREIWVSATPIPDGSGRPTDDNNQNDQVMAMIVESGDSHYVLDTAKLTEPVALFVAQPDGPGLKEALVRDRPKDRDVAVVDEHDIIRVVPSSDRRTPVKIADVTAITPAACAEGDR